MLLAALLCLVGSSCAAVAPGYGTEVGAGALGLAAGFLLGAWVAWREAVAMTRESYRLPIARARMHVRQLLKWATDDPDLQLTNAAVWERLHECEGALVDVTYPEPPRPTSWELRDLARSKRPRARVRR